MRLSAILIIFLFAVFTYSCWEEDEPVPPYIPPYDVVSVSLENSIYTHQIYFDLSTGMVASENENSEWALAFECSDSGFHIRINSSDFLGIAKTGSFNIENVFNDFSGYLWLADKSDGNADSTAVGEWVSNYPESPEYSNEVYILGKFDGIDYLPLKKLQFIKVDSSSFSLRIGNPESTETESIVIDKDSSVNYIQFSLEGNTTIKLEPLKTDWDVLFCQYHTILLTSDGIRAPYFVRGTLLNPYKVQAALDSISRFESIDFTRAIQEEFSDNKEAIGHNWKSVTIDESSNSAEYKVRPGYNYIIKDADDEVYKLRFKSYFNSSGVKGYPSFEFAVLDPV